jgi:hypothetical protein
MTFDPRVYAPLSPAVVAHDGRPVRADTSVTTDPATGLQRVTVVLREAVPAAGDLSIAAAVASGALYPHDLVRRPVTAKAGLRRSRRSAELARPLQARRPSSLGGATAPWGLELDAVWTQVSLAGQPAFRYYVPARITMRSVGPGIAPAPSLAIRLDPRLVRTLEVTSVTRNTKRDAGRGRVLGRDRSGSAFETRWGLQTRLAAGDVVDLEVLAVTTPTGRPLADLTRPVLSVLPARDPAGQRRTGRESLARVDVSWGDDG